jgi:hypothetical protein
LDEQHTDVCDSTNGTRNATQRTKRVVPRTRPTSKQSAVPFASNGAIVAFPGGARTTLQ